MQRPQSYVSQHVPMGAQAAGYVPSVPHVAANVSPMTASPLMHHPTTVVNPDNTFHTYATSHTTGVVPTALNTTYVSANTRLGAQARPASSVSSSDVSAVAKTISGTVYYTDDHYPPYYAKAHKITPVYKRRTNTCCQ
ncbi:MAG: hypothetical protein KVP17_005286 [Porospora cf. gigantea B]|uniref:uncharacterized protein n=1 Tax=Porospora cf. gigantea B TaxID=2853592 RepID=UPI003571E5A2|nr:MAG: hypothetical protein KVP17_005286 [Porospora cf. gigantea B]